TSSSHPIIYHFFFKCSRHHRDLHSFPTRRSSDLRPRRRQRSRPLCKSSRRPSKSRRRTRTNRFFDRWLARSLRVRGRAAKCGNRSEEHTSELQSRFDLVCRLLLEKKKKITRA